MDVPAGFAPFESRARFSSTSGRSRCARVTTGRSSASAPRSATPTTAARSRAGCCRRSPDFALGRAIEADAEDGKDRATVSLTVEGREIVRARADWVVAG